MAPIWYLFPCWTYWEGFYGPTDSHVQNYLKITWIDRTWRRLKGTMTEMLWLWLECFDYDRDDGISSNVNKIETVRENWRELPPASETMFVVLFVLLFIQINNSNETFCTSLPYLPAYMMYGYPITQWKRRDMNLPKKQPHLQRSCCKPDTKMIVPKTAISEVCVHNFDKTTGESSKAF